MQLHHIALKVQNLAQAETFYVGILGLSVIRRGNNEHGEPYSIWCRLGNNSILMLEATTTLTVSKNEHPGWHLLAFAITPEERHALEKKLQAHHIPVESSTQYSLYIRDPEGNRLGFSHWPDIQS